MKPGGWTVPPLWKGERCVIIAGGASAVPTWEALRHRLASTDRTIVIKDAAVLCPAADLFFYAEGRREGRFHKVRPHIWAAYQGPMRVKRSVVADPPEGVLQVHRQFKGNDEPNGLALEPWLLGGHCSGGSALNLAFHLGAKEIILVGYDMGGTHWQGDRHPMPRAPAHVHDRHRVSIDAMAKPLGKHGVRVLNCSPVSRLREFLSVKPKEI
jgi:hypothetical protein